MACFYLKIASVSSAGSAYVVYMVPLLVTADSLEWGFI